MVVELHRSSMFNRLSNSRYAGLLSIHSAEKMRKEGETACTDRHVVYAKTYNRAEALLLITIHFESPLDLVKREEIVSPPLFLLYHPAPLSSYFCHRLLIRFFRSFLHCFTLSSFLYD